jgi:copper transport outer membrane protein MctB
MSALRRHVLGLFAACAALAVGVALGAGPLQGDANADARSAPDTSGLRDQVASLQAGQTFGESVLAASSADLVGSVLAGGSVGLVVLPGVDDAVVRGIGDAVRHAGGQVNVTALVSRKLVDPAQKTYTASVATNSVKGLRDLRAVPSDQPYAQVAALFTRAYVGRGSDLQLDDEAVKIDSELRGAKLVGLKGALNRRASLVIVLASADHGNDAVTSASHVIEVQLLSALAAGSDAVLLATPPTGSAPGGLLDAVSKDASLRRARLSTLNVVDGAAAQVSAVYALAAAAHGATGEFGVDGTSVRLPPGLTGGR